MTPLQLETRIQELLDGTLAKEHWPELEQILSESDEARKLYCKHARMHGLLSQRSKGLKALTDPVPTIPIQQLLGIRRKKLLTYSSLAAAAVLLLTLVALQFIFIDTPKPHLAFEVAPGTQFTLTHKTPDEAPKGMELKPGSRLQVSQGTVALHFGSGVKSILQAPADIILHSKNSLQLKRGTAWFHVPKEAEGFRVVTEELNVVDLGTEFGIISNPGSLDEVHVFKGRVQVTAKYNRKGTCELTASQACKVNNVGSLPEIEINPSAFLTSLPEQLPYLHWSFDEDDQLACSGTHPAANSVTAKILGAHAEPSFQSSPGPFGESLRSLGQCGFVETSWMGIGDDAPRTLAYWIKLPEGVHYGYSYQTVGWGKFWGNYDLTTNQFYSYICSSGDGRSVSGVSLGGHWVGGFTNVADGKWHHIAHVFTGKHLEDGNPEIYCYVDGQPEQIQRNTHTALPRTKAGQIPVNTNIYDKESKPLSLLAHSWNNNRHGWEHQPSLDEIFVFSAALSAEQIHNLYRYNSYEGQQ